MYFSHGYFTGSFWKETEVQGSVTPDRANDFTEMYGYINIDTSRVVPTSNENRPVNIAVKWYIRAIAE